MVEKDSTEKGHLASALPEVLGWHLENLEDHSSCVAVDTKRKRCVESKRAKARPKILGDGQGRHLFCTAYCALIFLVVIQWLTAEVDL